MKYRTSFFVLLVVLIFIASGFFRDYVFHNVNAQMRTSYYGQKDTELDPGMKFLEGYTYLKLYYFKWILTLLFSVLFMGYTLALIRLYFPLKTYLRWVLLAYGFLFGVAALFWTGGFLANHSEKGYLIARFLMDMTQSPIMLIVLIPALRMLKKENAETPG
ncbi:MAG TPA: hypothetical protein VNZ86_21050 [Bacteroidia bacterium]|jgi:hypothetical protein|nr:hypothetical protein [Bacteroidia bacterium]